MFATESNIARSCRLRCMLALAFQIVSQPLVSNTYMSWALCELCNNFEEGFTKHLSGIAERGKRAAADGTRRWC